MIIVFLSGARARDISALVVSISSYQPRCFSVRSVSEGVSSEAVDLGNRTVLLRSNATGS